MATCDKIQMHKEVGKLCVRKMRVTCHCALTAAVMAPFLAV